MVFHAGRTMLNRVAVQSGNRPVFSTFVSAGPRNFARMPCFETVAISRKLVSTASLPGFPACDSCSTRCSTASELAR